MASRPRDRDSRRRVPDVYPLADVQRAPPRSPTARWQLTLEGTFITDVPALHEWLTWRVHRQGPTRASDALWLDDDLKIAHNIIISVVSVTPSELVLGLPGRREQFILDRA